MQLQFEKTIGTQKFTFAVNATNHKEFFEQVSFYSSLPSEGPNGEKDLQIVFRKTKQGYTYYSIVCNSAKKEYKFGESQQSEGDLFAKDWEDLYDASNAQASGSQAVDTSQGLGAVTPAPVQQATPAPQVGLGTPAPTPVQQAAPAPAAATNIATQADDVLAGFLGN